MPTIPANLADDPRFDCLIQSVNALGKAEAKKYFRLLARKDFSPEGSRKSLIATGAFDEAGNLTEPYRLPSELG